MKSLNNYILEKLVINKNYKQVGFFLYRTTKLQQIHIFSKSWPEFDKYKNNVYINNEPVELDAEGRTKERYKKGEYKVDILNIDDITNCDCMFFDSKNIISVPLFDTSKVENMNRMFLFCDNLENVPKFNTCEVNNMYQMFNSCFNLENVPLFDTSKVENMDHMFGFCYHLNEQTKKQWSKTYDFDKNDKI